MAWGWPSTTRQHSESQVSSKWSDFEPIFPKLGGNGCWTSFTGTSSSPTKPRLLKRELASDLALRIKCPLLASFHGYKNAYIASGNCRLGVTLAPATARLLVSMLNRTEQSLDHVYSSQLSWYDPNRFVSRSRQP